ncbi:MAG TPA: ATP-grasp domain-containing protein [Spirochaetia bacterium]|nr:ATP-grasp domain-containing protein [Spirochaetia bacterium]
MTDSSAEPRNLLLIGGGTMQLPVIEYAHRLGVKVVCFDGNPQAQARDRADWFVVCDIKDRDLCLERARDHQRSHRLDGVVTVGTDFSTTVAWIAGALKLPGTPYEAALLAKDKGLMRARFSEAGVASPRYQVFTGVPQDPHLEFPFPVVVKPVDNMGARGVRLVEGWEDLLPALKDAVGFSGTGRAIVEEYIDGPEFSLDAIVRDGQILRCGIADRTIVFPPAFVEIGHTFPSTASFEVQEAVWTEFERGIRALGLTWGAAKGDVKFSSTRGPVIGEIASRLSGGYMSGWTYPLTSGRSAVLWAVETALGDPLSSQPAEASLPVAERGWIGLPGRVKSIGGVEAARAVPGVKEVFLLVQPGRDTHFPRNNVEKLGNVIAVGATAADAEEATRRARNAVVFEYEAPHPDTEVFLRGEGPEAWWFPEARGLPDEGPARWLARGAAGQWRDLYGNSLGDLVALLEAEGINTHAQPPRFWRSLLVGGLTGARYAMAAV